MRSHQNLSGHLDGACALPGEEDCDRCLEAGHPRQQPVGWTPVWGGQDHRQGPPHGKTLWSNIYTYADGSSAEGIMILSHYVSTLVY